MTRTRRLLLAVTTCFALGTTMLATTSAEAAKPKAKLNSVGDRFVGGSVPIAGYLSGTGSAKNKTIKLQHQVNGAWHKAGKLRHQRDGKFTFPSQTADAAGVARWRVVVKRQGKQLDTSKPLSVNVLPTPVQPPPPPPPPTGKDVLPDLVARNISLCSDAERAEGQNGTCFRVEPFTKDDGTTITLLKFPATTWNIGAGAMEVRSHRDNPQVGTVSWHDTLSVQRIYNDNGGFRDVDITSGIDFFWEQLPTVGEDNHGHSHWHIFDFDGYTLDGSPDPQQKHGFCISSGAVNGPSLPGAGTLDPNYDDANACGFKQPNATDIIHGLSPLYGDTYPSNLEDQGVQLDPSTMNGTHHIQVCADHDNVLLETVEDNNCASADVTITEGVVTSVTNGIGYPH